MDDERGGGRRGGGPGREGYDFLAASRRFDAQMDKIAANNLQRQEFRILRVLDPGKFANCGFDAVA
jgi:hypothetical protein